MPFFGKFKTKIYIFEYFPKIPSEMNIYINPKKLQFAFYGQFVFVTCNVSIKELQLYLFQTFCVFTVMIEILIVYLSIFLFVCLSLPLFVNYFVPMVLDFFWIYKIKKSLTILWYCIFINYLLFFVYNIRNNEACNKHAAIHSFLLLTFFHLLLPGIISKFCVFKNVEFHVGTACVNCKLTRYNCACNFSSP